MTEPDYWRWTETDRWGQPVHCAEATWYRKLVGEQRPELAAHEDVIRETIRDPQWLYDDPEATTFTWEIGNPRSEVVHYVAAGRGRGRYTRNLVVVVVKWLPEGPAGAMVGYVRTMYLPRSLRGKLELRWERDVP